MTSSNFSNNPNKSQKQNFMAIAVTAGVILLGVLGYLAYSNLSKAKQLETTISELDESERLRTELEANYNQALADLEAQKTTNQELNAIIDKQKEELQKQKKMISGLIGSKGNLEKAKVEISNLKVQVDNYIAQIDNLKSENANLYGENQQLSQEKDKLSTDLQTKISENEELSATKAQLTSEKEVLTNKVNIASVVRMKNITAVGQKVRNSGKAVDENSAKSVEQIKVCFTTLFNEVAKAGNERFFVRIVNPLGETLAVESMGSGTLTDRKTGESVRYSMYSDLSFNQKEANECVIWAPTNPAFNPGKYTIEVYNKGYLAGTGSLSFK